MKNFYKIIDNKAQVGSGIAPDDTWVVYEIGQEPQELLELLNKEKQEQEDILAQQEAKLLREQAMLKGSIYTLNEVEYPISFTKNDGDGLVQVKSAFELGLANTVIVFENGTKLPITANEFIPFASWFVTKRNEFFT